MLLHGDCIEQSEQIESGSVDLILTDPPYGTVKNAPQNWTVGNNASHIWDDAIQPIDIFNIANRILRKNGKLVLFSQEPYTSQLITNAIPNVPFSYRMIWEKNDFANALLSKKAPVSYFEDILVFSKMEDIKINPIKEYTNKIRAFIAKPNYEIYEDFKTAGFKKYAVLDTFNSDKARRYNFHTLETYNNLIELYGIDKMQGFMSYEDAFKIYRDFEDKTLSTFNLWEGKKFKSNILKYKKDYNGYHPTQKPVALLEDLIKTYSNEGNLVVDLTCGSGSTAVAAINTNRRFIAIEKEDKYFQIANERINKAKTELKLF